MPAPRQRDAESLQVRPLGRMGRDDDTPGLAEQAARYADDTRQRACAMCEGTVDASGRQLHDPACLLA